MTFAMRVVMISGTYGQIVFEIPVVSKPPKDPSFHTVEESPKETLRSTTPAILMTSDAFFFGDIESFSTSLSDIRNKFRIAHQDGVPQTSLLLATMDDWLRKRSKSENVPLTKTLVLIPAADIPLPILLQVVASLKNTPTFQNVILSNGLI